MTQSIELAIADLQDKALALSGMKEAPDTATSSLNQFPFSLVYEARGELIIESSGFAHDLATIYVEHHVGNQVLPLAIQTAAALRDPFLKKLRDDPTLGGTVDTINAIRRQFGQLRYGETTSIGYRYEIDVKITLTA